MMSWIDWLVIIVPTLIIGCVAVVVQRHVKSVADFMAAGRLSGRYLICNASGETGMALINAVGMFEIFNKAGFTVGWWTSLATPAWLFMSLSGFVIYRYRETRTMTPSQLFEIRYSRPFRLFTGSLAFFAGVLNYGIFPAVGGRFFVYFCGLPPALHCGPITIPTFAVVMALYLGVSLWMTLSGGQMTIMVSDAIEGILSMALFFVVIIALLMMFSWSQFYDVMAHQPAGQSLINPFDAGQITDFNIWYVLIGIFVNVYSYKSWQGGFAFNSCALNPHEAKMAGILGYWRGQGRWVMYTLLSLCAYTYLRHPDFAAGAAAVHQTLNAIPEDQIREQMTTPVTLGHLLPVGVRGVVGAIFLFGLVACDGSYLHSWGSILIQDVVVPLRKKPFSPEVHLRLLRWAIFGVAVFGFLFGLLFNQTDYIMMFFAITGAVYLGGAGCVMLGGLYWKKGTTQAAWCAMIVGSLLSLGGMVIQQPTVWHEAPTVTAHLVKVWPALAGIGWVHNLQTNFPDKFPVNGQILSFFIMLTSIALYVTVSLLTCKADFDLDRMLHRGRYAVEEDGTKLEETTPPKPISRLKALIGIDDQFTRGDRILSWSVFGWTMFWFLVFLVVTVWNLIDRWPLVWWSNYWHVTIIVLPLIMSVVTTIWFSWGGILDLVRLFRSLKTVERNEKDDGTVVGHRNLDEV